MTTLTGLLPAYEAIDQLNRAARTPDAPKDWIYILKEEAIARAFRTGVAVQRNVFARVKCRSCGGSGTWRWDSGDTDRCRTCAASRLRGVVMFSDPVPRTTVDGRLVLPGHVGTIYQASNARYRGRSTPRTLHLLPDGTAFSDRPAQKIRTLDTGWEYATAQLVGHGADPLTGDPREWLRRWLPRITRTFRHPGNHRYAFGLSRATKNALGKWQAAQVKAPVYPKQIDRRAA